MQQNLQLDIAYTDAEYSEWVTDSDLTERFGITFSDNGWYELNNGDYLLAIARHGKLKIWLWLDFDPRDEMDKILGLPTIKPD